MSSISETPFRQIPDQPPRELRFRRKLSPRADLIELARSRRLLRALTERELRVRYKQAHLGFAWAILTPATLMIIFTLLSAHSVINIGTSGKPAYLFAYAGLVPWTFFANSITQGGMSLVTNLYLVNKIYCPREVFPISSVLVSIVDGFVASLIFLVLFPIGHTTPSVTSYWIPFLFLLEVIFTLGIALIASIIVVYLRDLRHLIPIIVQFGLFATPVMYSLSKLPENIQVIYSAINPLAPIIDSIRQAILFDQGPEWNLLAYAIPSSLIYLAIGYSLFKRLEPRVADVA